MLREERAASAAPTSVWLLTKWKDSFDIITHSSLTNFLQFILTSRFSEEDD